MNYKGANDTIECVRSLLDQSEPIYRIIVVDNDSPTDDYEVLTKTFADEEKVIVIKSPKNGGFAYGNNIAIQFALEHLKPDFFLLINNDTVADSHLHEELLNAYKMNVDKRVGIVTGKIYYYRERTKIWFAGGYFSKLKCCGEHIGLDSYDEDLEESTATREITFATGCLWFLPSHLLKEVGYLPEEYFLYLEDVDYCLNLQKLGYKIIYNPKAKIWHKVGASSRITRHVPNYYWNNRNRIILCWKYFGTLQAILFCVFFLIPTRVIRFIQYLLKKQILNTFSGTIDGLKFILNRERGET